MARELEALSRLLKFFTMKKNNEEKITVCPICDFNKSDDLLKLNCGNFDNSFIYRNARVVACGKCGHVYNALSVGEIADLEEYYEKESAAGNTNPIDNISDRPGSNSQLAAKRYRKLYNFMRPRIKKGMRILDAGCASGGFLDFLYGNNFRNLYGLDVSRRYITIAKQKKLYEVKIGKVEAMPFKDGSMDLVLFDQTMEHLVNPKKAIQEAKRVLSESGLLCVSVPDGSRYGETYFFDFFWFLIREHIQHFDMSHLRLLCASEGFESVSSSKYKTPMMSEKMILPVLNLIFRKTGEEEVVIKRNHLKLKERIAACVSDDLRRMAGRKSVINKLIKSQKPVYVWGMGREFLYLYESANLKKCNLAGLIDIDPYKQNKYSIDGRKISNPSVLKMASRGSILVIGATAHAKKINDLAVALGYSGLVISV